MQRLPLPSAGLPSAGRFLSYLAALGLIAAYAISPAHSETAPVITAPGIADPKVITPVVNDEIKGLHAVLVDTTERYRRKNPWLRWHTYWELRWEPCPGAVDYLLAYSTSEGTSKKLITLTQPLYRLEVAKGDNPAKMGLSNRKLQLDTIQGMLSARVAARFADGTLSAPSPWMRVGQAYPLPR